jgi:transketolase
MRNAFAQTLLELAAQDRRVFLLTADLGWSVLDTFADRFPERFLNVGVAEQNLASIATGLAKAGYIPFAYSIATFASMRCYEQFRDGAVCHGLPVRLVGMGGGFAYGHAGRSHYSMEDLALARVQPGLMTLAPADSAQTRTVVQALLDLPGPAYLRLDKAEEADIPGLEGRFAPDRPELVRAGRDLIFLSAGSITHEVVKAADLLRREGIAAAVAVAAHIGFRCSPALVDLLRSYAHVIAVDDAFSVGGLGSLAAETIAEHLPACRLLRAGVEVPLDNVTGSREFMRRRHGLDADSLARSARRWLPAQP